MIPKLTEIIKKGEADLLKEMGVSIDDRKIDAIILTIQKYLNINTTPYNKFSQNNNGKK